MKKITVLFSAIALILGLCACGQTSSSTTTTWQEQYDLGLRYLSEGNYEEAIIAFTAAIEIDPKQAEAYAGLANAYIAIGDYDKAEEAIASGQAVCGTQNIFNNILDELAQYRTMNSDDLEYADITEMFQSDNAVNYGDLPILFSAPFNGLENYLPIVNDSKELNYYYEFEMTGSYSNENNSRDYTINVWSCNYDFYDRLDPSRPNIASSNRVTAIAPTGSTNILGIDIQLVRETIDEIGYYGPIGLMDISFGDSYDIALKKLGLDADQAGKYKGISIKLYEDGRVWGWGQQNPLGYYSDNPDAPMIILTFYTSEQTQNGKRVELVFGEKERLNYIRYDNWDLLDSLIG